MGSHRRFHRRGIALHSTFGYYAQGVGPDTAILPAGWESRAIRINTPGTRGATGIALEIHDLLVAKYAAGRDKDRAFGRTAFETGLAVPEQVLERVTTAPLDERNRTRIAAMIRADTRK
jgi:hypothetical protein